MSAVRSRPRAPLINTAVKGGFFVLSPIELRFFKTRSLGDGPRFGIFLSLRLLPFPSLKEMTKMLQTKTTSSCCFCLAIPTRTTYKYRRYFFASGAIQKLFAKFLIFFQGLNVLLNFYGYTILDFVILRRLYHG